MIQSDGRKDCHIRIVDHVGGIQFAAHADFKYHDIAGIFLEIHQGDRRVQFELRRLILHGVCKRTDVGRDLRQFFIRDILVVDLHALIKDLDIRGGKKAYLVASLDQHSRKKSGG